MNKDTRTRGSSSPIPPRQCGKSNDLSIYQRVILGCITDRAADRESIRRTDDLVELACHHHTYTAFHRHQIKAARQSLAIHSSQVRIIIVWLLHLQISRWDWLWHGTKSRRNIFYTQIPSSSQYHRTPSLDFGLKRFWYAMPANLPSPISKIVLNKTFREHGYMAMGDWILLKNIKKSITSIL